MNQDMLFIIIIVESIVIAVMGALLYRSYPPAMLEILRVVVGLLKEKAAMTPGTQDDQAVGALEKLLDNVPVAKG